MVDKGAATTAKTADPSTGGPAVAQTARAYASGTVYHKDASGKRHVFHHGDLMELPTSDLRHLAKRGAAVRDKPGAMLAPGVEQESYVLDEETGLYVDPQGSTHDPNQPDIAKGPKQPASGGQ